MWFAEGGGLRYPQALKSLRSRKIMIIPDHYYWPLINPDQLTRGLDEIRNLPGIRFALSEQRKFLRQITTVDEIRGLGWADAPSAKVQGEPKFSLGNGAFEAGDAEILHHVVRQLKPANVIEIGSGNSTKIVAQAIDMNRRETGFASNHSCVEPFEKPWLEQLPSVSVMREKIENLDPKIFRHMQAGDFLFIDSSHIIRPQGDVLFLYLEILPILPSGVVVHIHDFFSPSDYPEEWLVERRLLWNEQYLVEALISDTNRYKVLLSLNNLHRSHYQDLRSVCPHLTRQHNPGSLYISIV